ncbi:MAG: FmdB family transcriptional regulator [Gammaproteobacteria bacterium]|nr:MAG: FmdB family transcriptional regulator [Gammaproteobacteria bacterium]
MPFYEYQCQSCGHEFTKMQAISAEPLTDCPECSKAELKKVISAPRFSKGDKWLNSPTLDRANKESFMDNDARHAKQMHDDEYNSKTMGPPKPPHGHDPTDPKGLRFIDDPVPKPDPKPVGTTKKSD